MPEQLELSPTAPTVGIVECRSLLADCKATALTLDARAGRLEISSQLVEMQGKEQREAWDAQNGIAASARLEVDRQLAELRALITQLTELATAPK